MNTLRSTSSTRHHHKLRRPPPINLLLQHNHDPRQHQNLQGPHIRLPPLPLPQIHKQPSTIPSRRTRRTLSPQLLTPHQLRNASPLLLLLAPRERHASNLIQHQQTTRAYGLSLLPRSIAPLERAQVGADILSAGMDAAAADFEFFVVGDFALEVDFGIASRAEAVCGGGERVLGEVVGGVDEDAVSGAAGLAEGLVG